MGKVSEIQIGLIIPKDVHGETLPYGKVCYKMRPRHISEDTWQFMKAEYECGKSIYSIAKAYHVDDGYLSRAAKKRGWQKNAMTELVRQEVNAIETINDIDRQVAEQGEAYKTQFREVVQMELETRKLAYNLNQKLMQKGEELTENISNAREFMLMAMGAEKLMPKQPSNNGVTVNNQIANIDAPDPRKMMEELIGRARERQG